MLRRMDMKTLIESLSLGSGAILIAIVSTGTVWLLSLVLRGAFARWACVLAIPFFLAYSLYWLPVWLGADRVGYDVWKFLGVATYFLAGFFRVLV